MSATTDDTRIGDLIRAYMKAHDLSTHEEMAQVLGVERSLVSKYISGTRVCRDVTQLRRMADAMGLPPEAVGLLSVGNYGRTDPTDEVAEWRLVRQTLNRNRHALTAVAARMYWDPVRYSTPSGGGCDGLAEGR